jgi:hypothetical protein
VVRRSALTYIRTRRERIFFTAPAASLQQPAESLNDFLLFLIIRRLQRIFLDKNRRPNDRKFARLRPFLYQNFAILRCVEEKKQKYNELCT